MPDPKAARRSILGTTLVATAVGYLLGVGLMVAAILRSPSSTAVIGFLFVPVYALVPGALGALFGATGGYVWQARHDAGRRTSPTVVAAAIVFAALMVGTGSFLSTKWSIAEAVADVSEMDAASLEHYFARGPLHRNKFVLGAMALNPEANAELLAAIAALEDASLHEEMGSIFPILGQNARGLAVMRLVARHEHTNTATLERLSQSSNLYVLSDVAGNARTPEAVLRRLDGNSNTLVEWGLARNPGTPVDLIRELANSDNEYTRSSVARNPATPSDVLEPLASDPAWHVRREVATNISTEISALEHLMLDENEMVKAAAQRNLERR